MFKNYLTVALRVLVRQKGYIALNILGLTLGLSCAFLIALWIRDELRYDRFHEQADRLYRVLLHAQFPDATYTGDTVPWPLAELLSSTYDEVEDVAVATPARPFVLRHGELATRERGWHATPSFLTLFSWHLLQGEAEAALHDPTSVVISSSVAARYFGPDWQERDAAVGRLLEVNDRPFTVTGVFADPPSQSSLRFDVLLPIQDYLQHQTGLDNWSNSNVRLFVRLCEGADATTLSTAIADLQDDRLGDDSFRSELFLQAFTDQHLHSTFEDGVRVTGSVEVYVRIFSVVALMVLLIACINFINLDTARSLRRAREIGIRKAIGAERSAITGQFMGESLLLVSMAFVVALGVVSAALPVFNELTGKTLGLADLGGRTLLLFGGIGVLTALLAGTYPALYLSGFDPLHVLRGPLQAGGGVARLRKALTVVQFGLSIVLIVGTTTVYQQIDYTQSKGLGLNPDDVVYLSLRGPIRAQYEAAKDALLQQPGIAAVTAMSENPLQLRASTHAVSWRGKDPVQNLPVHLLSVRPDFRDVLEIELADGHGFDEVVSGENVAYLVNERAAQAMGFDDPLGEQLQLWAQESGPIVGVVEDFHMASFHSEIAPTVIRLAPSDAGWLYVRTEPGQTAAALAGLATVYEQLNPGQPFVYRFLDESHRAMYRGEVVLGALARYFTGLALLIAGLGLFGLAAFTTQQRTKEMGVRKVLGASVAGLVAMLSREFVALVALAFVLAAPVAYLAAEQWLSGFAYRIDLGLGPFVLTGLVVLGLTVATVSYQALRTALANPIHSLRSE
ncbi:MAG: ABC transporter permease [Bacteroidota bacterium]